jgi:pimeloyl-ACP methyl ester carboxylesterase
VIANGGPSPRNGPVSEIVAAAAALTDPVDPAFVRAFQESTVHRPVPPDFMNLVIAESLKLPARVWQAALAGMLEHDSVERLITSPTLVIGGEEDAVFSVAEQRALAASIGGARLHLMPGIGHTPHWEDPDGFAALLVRELLLD